MSERRRNKGFTIIELMIATVVFSMVLIIILGVVIQFGRVYYKGVIQTRTQERARAITEDVAKHIQFGKTIQVTPLVEPAPGVPSLFCAGTQGYTYALKVQRINNLHALVRTNSCEAYPDMTTSDLQPGASEMLSDNMQLVRMTVTQQSEDRYTISVRVVYGENGDFEPTARNPNGDPTQPCKQISLGGQFCAISELTTTVIKRLK